MILVAGLFLRHYGVYKNINYIPLSDGENFTSLIGENGVGKSSILDALDKYFNHKDSKDWVINKQAQLEGGISTNDKTPFISPLFLISKSESADSLNDELTTSLELISNYFWSSSKKSVLDDFYNHRDAIKISKSESTHYLVSIGKRHNEKDAFFLTFEPELKNYSKTQILISRQKRQSC